MIQLEISDGWVRPVVACNMCHARIESADKGAAVPMPDHPIGNGKVQVVHVHKGPCLDAIQNQYGVLEWEELSRHIRCLVDNLGMGQHGMEAQKSMDREFGNTREGDADQDTADADLT